MPTLVLSPDEIKLMKERRRFEREPLQAVPDTMRWTLRCMNQGCLWNPPGEYANGEAARTDGESHNESTGHPVKLRVLVEFDAGIIRAKGTVR